MVKIFFSAVLFILFSTSSSFSQEKMERPKLVVGIVVDQMRYDYLYRYFDKYSDRGFKRMMSKGFTCENMHYNYVPTITAPGHSSIYTGTTPAYHGIIGNDWHQRYSRESMYCVEDKTVQVVGGVNEAAGKKSPVNLLASTITDELKLYFHDQSKIISIALKDRAAVLPGGHHPNGAFWYDESAGNFITSTYYMNALPSWLSEFNDEKWSLKLLQQGWSTLLPLSEYTASMPDRNPYEGKLPQDKESVFPRTFSTINPNYANITTTPLGNILTTQLAIKAIAAENLGADNITDFLAISYSVPDYAGHLFGLQSVEIEDIYLRLDLELATLLETLDNVVGKDQYMVFLSADHAAAQVPQLLIDGRYPAGYFENQKLIDTIKKVISAKYDPYIIEGASNFQIFLNEDRIKFKMKPKREDIVKDIKEIIKSFPGVYDAFERSEIPFLSSEFPLYKMIQLGFNPVRSGDIIYTLLPGWLDRGIKTGTSHGSPWNYDTHVPAIFYGWHVPSGKSYSHHDITDIAPTISHLVKIPLPSASIGNPLEFVK
ncbi:MAG: alkaline phosphatase PafA [Saprospiraceae bacterium]